MFVFVRTGRRDDDNEGDEAFTQSSSEHRRRQQLQDSVELQRIFQQLGKEISCSHET